MRAQLARIIEVASLPKVTFQLIPFDVAARHSPNRTTEHHRVSLLLRYVCSASRAAFRETQIW